MKIEIWPSRMKHYDFEVKYKSSKKNQVSHPHFVFKKIIQEYSKLINHSI